MKNFGKWVVKMRIPILIISLLLLIPSFFGYVGTRVNYDILSYLPKDIETMVGQDILGHVEPESGHLSQDGSLLCHIILQNNVETTDTVGGNHDQAVAVVIDLAYFSFFDWFHNVSLSLS